MKTSKLPPPYEDQLQESTATWINPQYPEVRAYHIPNGGKRHPKVGAKLKRQGVRPSVPDWHIPVARGGYHSMYVELKREGVSVPPEQREMHEFLRGQGHYVAVCKTLQQFMDSVNEYLNA